MIRAEAINQIVAMPGEWVKLASSPCLHCGNREGWCEPEIERRQGIAVRVDEVVLTPREIRYISHDLASGPGGTCAPILTGDIERKHGDQVLAKFAHQILCPICRKAGMAEAAKCQGDDVAKCPLGSSEKLFPDAGHLPSVDPVYQQLLAEMQEEQATGRAARVDDIVHRPPSDDTPRKSA